MSEALSRMGPKTQNWSGVTGAQIQALTAADRAGGCRGLKPEALLYAQLKYVHDVRSDEMMACSVFSKHRRGREGLRADMYRLNLAAVLYATHKSRQDDWFGKALKQGGSYFPGQIGELALAESIGARACACCKGTGQKEKDGRIVECCRCRGNKNSKMPLREKAILLNGMPETTFRRHWQVIYEGIYSRFEGWDSDIKARVRVERRDGDEQLS